MASFKELFKNAKKTDSYWTEKTILDFSIELHDIMKKRGLSKKEFAEKLGKSQAYVTKVFRGNANFTIETMVKLVRALDGDLSLHIIPKEEKITPKKEKSSTWLRIVGKNKSVNAKPRWGHAYTSELVSGPPVADQSNNTSVGIAV